MNIVALLGNILWMLGLAIVVSTLGWRLWQARSPYTNSGIETSKFALDAGITFFCFGIFLSTNQLWARILFLIIAISLILLTILDRISSVEGAR